MELARIVLADFNPPVTGIAAQPFVLAGADGTGNGVMFLACCWRTRTAGVTVVDVKATSRMTDPGVREQFAWARAARVEPYTPAAAAYPVVLLTRSAVSLRRRRGRVVPGGLSTEIHLACDERPAIVDTAHTGQEGGHRG